MKRKFRTAVDLMSCQFSVNTQYPKQLLLKLKPIAFFLAAAGMSFGVQAQSAEKKVASTSATTELIVLYDDRPGKAASPATAADIVDAVKEGRAPNSVQADLARLSKLSSLHAELGAPESARYSLADRINYRVDLIRKPKGAPADYEPPEVTLQKYVVLSYPDRVKAEAALKQLKRNPNVRWVGENTVIVKPSAAPNDPYANPGSPVNPANYQWGLHAINAPAAWDVVRGNAYVGILDTGVQLSTSNPSQIAHPDLASKFRPQYARTFLPNDNSVDEKSKPFLDGANNPLAGHGTHVMGVIMASTNNSQGIAGVCVSCTPIISKVLGAGGGYAQAATGISWAVNQGAQALNMSFGDENNHFSTGNACASDPEHVFCKAIELANNRDVVMVAAAGNDNSSTSLQMPSRDPRVIPVGAINSGGVRWSSSYTYTEFTPPYTAISGSDQGADLAARGVVAPGVDVLSAFYTGAKWVGAGYPCNDNAALGLVPELGYDLCTGTSMAAPHVSGVVALMRSLNPLLSKNQIRDLLLASSSNHVSPTNTLGHGLPNAYSAVKNVEATTNRLTPLFSFYSSSKTDYFYTTNPQAGSAAVSNEFPIENAGYGSVGGAVNVDGSGNYQFPGTTVNAGADVWIFTSHNNPINSSAELRPLYRLSSFRQGKNDFAYINDLSDLPNWTGYDYDGIEGYIYPPNLPKPAGTVALIRAYNSATKDYAIFPETQSMPPNYVAGVTLGYAYENKGQRPSWGASLAWLFQILSDD